MSGSRPEKTIYSITDRGVESFRSKLATFLEFEYRPIFSSDSVFYFSEYLTTQDISGKKTILWRNEYFQTPFFSSTQPRPLEAAPKCFANNRTHKNMVFTLCINTTHSTCLEQPNDNIGTLWGPALADSWYLLINFIENNSLFFQRYFTYLITIFH